MEANAMILEFVAESRESLDQFDQDLITLEKTPHSPDVLENIFRTIHNIKGSCGLIGYAKLESLTHSGESLLDKLQQGEVASTLEVMNTLHELSDSIRRIFTCVARQGNEGDQEFSELIETMERLQTEKSSKPSSGNGNTKKPDAPSSKEVINLTPGNGKLETQPSNEKVEVTSDNTDAKKEERKLEDSSIRVDVELLDKLMNLVGELVLARNQVLQFSSTLHDAAFLETSQHLNLVTSDLQEGVMKTRMQPIGGIWAKFPRIVRDLSMECGKKIRLETEGKDTDLDKTLIEAIKDPLTHIIRNSVDHGIETPDVRRNHGKPEEGVLKLKAFHEGGQVNIEISDDGAGIDSIILKEKALSKGLITSEQAAKMSEREMVNLIFMPGLSTAKKVTNVSGRGVGMDVVKTNIEKIGGTVDINTRMGKGTTLKIKIPLTLAIIPTLIVSTGGNQYAIPQVNLLELVRLDKGQSENAIETVQGTPVYRLRGNLLPIVNLHDELGVAEKDIDRTVTNIVVLSANERQFGLVVEQICDAEEIVVKPLGSQLKGISTFAGATIMGDGSVALILDIIGLAEKANVIRENQEQAVAETRGNGQAGKELTDKETLLIFRIGKEGRNSIPLSSVARLEEFKCSDIEHSGNNEVIRYREEIIPLIDLAKFFDSSKQVEKNETIQTIIYTHQNRSVALVVDKILDIVEENITVKRSLTRKGILGAVVVQNKVTDLIDLEGIVREMDPEFFDERQEVLSLTQ